MSFCKRKGALSQKKNRVDLEKYIRVEHQASKLLRRSGVVYKFLFRKSAFVFEANVSTSPFHLVRIALNPVKTRGKNDFTGIPRLVGTKRMCTKRKKIAVAKDRNYLTLLRSNQNKTKCALNESM